MKTKVLGADTLIYQQEWEHAGKYRFKVVEQFEEPIFSNLIQQTFFEGFPSIDMQKVLSEQEKTRDREFKARIKDRFMLRIAAYCDGEFIGWTVGWQDTDNRFYMANSAVLPEHRQQGVYQQLVASVLRITKEEGFQVVVSNHLAANNAVIIPKLKAGFVITGVEMIEWVGMTIKMAFYHHRVRHDAYQYRVGMAPPSDVIKGMLGLTGSPRQTDG